MRRLLNPLYTWAAWLAGLFMVITLLCVLAGIMGRLWHFDWQGLDAYAGYAMAAASFLALASTLRHGEHIRVTLILGRFPQGSRAHQALEIFCHLLAAFFSGTLAWFSIHLAWQSYNFNDVSTGLDATPLWIPQIGMAAGSTLLFTAFVQELSTLLAGQAIEHEKHDAAAAFTE